MPVKSPRFALFDLAEGKSYSFRVRCCNSAGVGEPSVSTGEITVGDKLGEPANIYKSNSVAAPAGIFHDVFLSLPSCDCIHVIVFL